MAARYWEMAIGFECFWACRAFYGISRIPAPSPKSVCMPPFTRFGRPHRFPHRGELKELYMLGSLIHSSKALYHQEGVNLNLRNCPASPIPSIQPIPSPQCMTVATKLRQKKIGGIVSKMTSDPLNGVLSVSLIPASPCIVSYINLHLSTLLQGLSKDRPGCAVHYWEI